MKRKERKRTVPKKLKKEYTEKKDENMKKEWKARGNDISFCIFSIA